MPALPRHLILATLLTSLAACADAPRDDAPNIADTTPNTINAPHDAPDDLPTSPPDMRPDAVIDDPDLIDTPGDAPDDAPIDQPPPAPTTTRAFIAQGHMGRTMMSCDGGHSWIADRSLDATLKCWDPDADNKPDCDHHPGAGRGITSHGGITLATFGWGPPGAIWRSEDGQNWTTPLEDTTFGGVATDGTTWLAAARRPRLSHDGGLTFTQGGDSMMRTGNVRRAAHVISAAGGRFIMVGDDADIVVSPDGMTWQAATASASCGANIQTAGGIAALNGIIVIVGGDGVACHSSDGGQTFSAQELGASISGQLVVHDGHLKTWSRGKLHRSADATTWTTHDLTPSNLTPGPSAAEPDGAIVAIRGGWQTWYDRQEYYRSDDGITWTTLAPNPALTGHPIRAITTATVPIRGECAPLASSPE